MFVRIWKFRVKKELQSDFEKAYGPEGSWADLFKRAEGFIGTELLRRYSEDAIYVTIDRWASKANFGSFISEFAIDYEPSRGPSNL